MDGSEQRQGRIKAGNVTTACDSCRSKRCKCSGYAPCSSCVAIGSSCTFSHQDGRTHSYEQQKGSKVGHATEKTGRNGVSTAQISSDTNSLCRARGGYPTIHEREVNTLMRAEANHFQISHSRARPMIKKGSNRLDRAWTKDVKSVKDLQGRFRVDTNALSKPPIASTTRRSCPKLLPKSAMAYFEQEAHSCNTKRSAEQQQPSHFVWKVERRRYPTPGYTRFFGNLPFSSSISANGFPADVQAHQARNFSAPQHLVLPLFEPDDSPLGRALIDFQRLAKRLLAEGTSSSMIIDEGLTDVTLFFRDRLPTDPLNASTWTSEMLRSFRGTFPDEVLLACATCVVGLVRWLLQPTPVSYANIPSIMRPTALQRIKPHAPWIDLMIFPSFRNALVKQPRDWAGPCMEAQWSLSCPWLFEDVHFHAPETHQVFLPAKFSDYVAHPENWSMQKSILSHFPEIAATEINIVDR